MLIIPLTGKISWRNPPLVTIGLILVNCLVFFIFQFGENARLMDAAYFYSESGLAEIELPRYMEHRERKGEELPEDFPPREEWGPEAKFYLFQEMQQDPDFYRRLTSNRIITPDNTLYYEWKDLRSSFEERMDSVTSIRYGFRPALHRAETFFTYMFLHGGFFHLLGNMVFLWLVGCILEMGLGRLPYLVLYLTGGILSVILFWQIYSQSYTPLVGASGAIAGLMGAFTLLYGRQKVTIFLSLGFYFSTFKVPGILLLPVWVGNELYQLGFGGPSNVAYVAHLGGLIGGALLGFGLSRLPTGDREVFAEQEADPAAPLLEEAYQRLGRLDMEGARPLIDQVLSIDPDNLAAKRMRFNILKQSPHDPAFIHAATALLGQLIAEEAPKDTVVDAFATFTALAPAAKLPAGLRLKLVHRLAEAGQVAKAEKILAGLIKNNPADPGLPSALIKLADAYGNGENPDKKRKCLALVAKKFPATEEGALAERELKSIC